MITREQNHKTKNNTTNDLLSWLGSKVDNRSQSYKTHSVLSQHVSVSPTKHFFFVSNI